MADDKRDFTVNGKEYAVRVPTVQEIKEANETRSRTFNDALQRGDMLREQLESELRKRELWNDQREMEYQTLRREVVDGEYKLQKGGIKLKTAKQIALKMAENRNKMVELLSSRTDLDSNTCEGKADAARFNYLFACCLVYGESGEHYFPNKLDDYLLNQDDPVAAHGATEFYYLLSGSDTIDDKLPENKFLKKFKFVDNDYRLIDEDQKLVDSDGKHIDEYGNYIKWKKDGSFVKIDDKGREIDQEGDFSQEHSSFLDDKGNPIDETAYEEVVEEVEEEVGESDEATVEAEESKPKPKAQRKPKKQTKAAAKSTVKAQSEES